MIGRKVLMIAAQSELQFCGIASANPLDDVQTSPPAAMGVLACWYSEYDSPRKSLPDSCLGRSASRRESADTIMVCVDRPSQKETCIRSGHKIALTVSAGEQRCRSVDDSSAATHRTVAWGRGQPVRAGPGMVDRQFEWPSRDVGGYTVVLGSYQARTGAEYLTSPMSR